MARISEQNARDGVSAISAKVETISARIGSDDARRDFDRAASDLVRLVEDRIEVRVPGGTSDGANSRRLAGTAGGSVAQVRGEGGPTVPQPAPHVPGHSVSDPREAEKERPTPEPGRAMDRPEGEPARLTPPSREAGHGVSVESSEERLRDRIERERAQDRTVER